MNDILNTLLEKAKTASQNAYAPYSKFKVGAAVRTSSGAIYTGCNVENSSYSMTLCAERNAIFHAISQGERIITEIAIYVDNDELFPPCGACRQVMAEFASDLPIVYASRKEVQETRLSELLPQSFLLKHD
ncbi:MAG TPA: cytidine deaminase [Candidatus Cloacimonadota bacterium]|nr:cytidine deaminase [Candidatus Cloacimonadota bacterium]HPT71616.1 cytidine deaminase [Candidatus Cloacimonadota bacterium]